MKPFLAIKTTIFQSPKNRFFAKGLAHAFSQKMYFSFFLFSVKIRLQIMFKNVLDRKKPFYGHKNFNLSKSQKTHFSKGVNPCFWSKNVIFSLFVFRQNKTRNNV